jgi:hypothetical protein
MEPKSDEVTATFKSAVEQLISTHVQETNGTRREDVIVID